MEIIQDIGRDFLDMVMPTVLSLLAAYAVYGLNKLISKMKLQTTAIANEQQRALLLAALDDMERLTEKTVSTIEQTTAKALRTRIKDGEELPEAMKALAQQAADEIAAALAPETNLIIERQYGSFRDYLTKCIETKVLELKMAEHGGVKG